MTAWKDVERRVCRALGYERRGPLGRYASDCVEGCPFAVEVKRSKQGAVLTKWLEQAKRQGRDEGKPWLLVVAGHNDRSPTVTLDWKGFLALLASIERLKDERDRQQDWIDRVNPA
jgi:hypothetical protein